MSSIFSHASRRNLFGTTSHRDSRWFKIGLKVPLVVGGFILLASIGEIQLWLAAAVFAALAWNRPAITAVIIFGVAALWFLFGLLLGVDGLQPNIWLPLGVAAGLLFVKNVAGLAGAVGLIALTWFFLVALNLQDLPLVGTLSWLVAALILVALVVLVAAVIKYANDLSFALIVLAWAIVLAKWFVFSYSGLNYNQPAWSPWDLDQVWYLLALVAAGFICSLLLHRGRAADDATDGDGDDPNATPDPTRPHGAPDPPTTVNLDDRDAVVAWLRRQTPDELFYDRGHTRFSASFFRSHPGLMDAVLNHNIQESEITQHTPTM